jgi:hypothetical protein
LRASCHDGKEKKDGNQKTPQSDRFSMLHLKLLSC